MKKFLLFAFAIALVGCAELQQIASQHPNVGGIDIAAGLREALQFGIDKQVSKLTATDGFFKNQAVKILLPPELEKVDGALRKMGLSALADDGLKVLNRAAEEAVKEGTPVFVEAVRKITFADAKNILMGNDRAATDYLQQSTSTALYGKFNPVVKRSLSKVNADKIWNQIITKYNAIPLVQKVNPDLTDYVTNRAMSGVFKMISVEEKTIRTNIKSRTTPLLQQVFALQD